MAKAATRRSDEKDEPAPDIASVVTGLLGSLQIERPDEIDVELLAAHLGVIVLRRPLANEEGHLVRRGGRGIVVVNETAFASAKWRFVVAHELGHFLLHQHVDHFERCTVAGRPNRTLRVRRVESQANHFASQTLMPTHMAAPACARARPSLELVREVAAAFRTSLSATALRMVALTEQPCGVVHSTAGKVTWTSATKAFRVPLRPGKLVAEQTRAGALFADRPVDDVEAIVDARSWAADGAAVDVELVEQSVKLGDFGSVLTVLRHLP